MTPLAIVVAAMVALAVVALCYRIVKGGKGGHIVVKAGPVSFDFQAAIEQIAADVKETNVSVNGVKPGEPKLRETVERMATKVDRMADVQSWQTASIRDVADAVGVTLTPTPRAS